MTPKKPKRGRKTHLRPFNRRAVAALVMLVGAVAASNLLPACTTVNADITAKEIVFLYPAPADESRENASRRKKTPLLVNNRFEELAVTPFDSIQSTVGVLAMEDPTSPDRWRPIATRGPIRIMASPQEDAFAIFKAVTLTDWTFDRQARLTMTATPHAGKRGMVVFVENAATTISLSAADSILVECHRCRIDNPEDEILTRIFPKITLKLSGLRGIPVTVNGSGTSITLDVTAQELKPEQFSIWQPQFCAGEETEPPSTIVAASVSFPAIGKIRKVIGDGTPHLPRSAVLQIEAAGSLFVNEFHLKGAGEDNVLQFKLSGRARRVAVASTCEERGALESPSYFEIVKHQPLIATIIASLAFVLAGISTYDKLRDKLWGRERQ